MSLRCVGSQLLQTVPSPLLTGTSTASLSMWVRVNPGSTIADPAGVTLFDGGGSLSIGLSATNDLQVAWSANSDGADVSSNWSQPLLPGVNYHLAVTWQAGVQRYYLNGVLVRSDNEPGSLGKLGTPPTQPFRLGSSGAGADVTLDEPTLWVGYALTASDAQMLRDRIASPETISHSSLALHWSLAGADGASAVPGEAGLVDTSATGLDLAPVMGTAPTYQGGALTYSLLDGGCSARVAPSGQGILFKFHDPATNPVAVAAMSSDNEQQTITINGWPSGGAFSLGFQGQTTGPIPVIPSPPPAYFRWNVGLAAPGDVDLAVNLRGPFLTQSDAVLYEIMDDGAVIGSATLNTRTASGNPASFTDGSKTASGASVKWVPLGRFTTATTALSVRVSCPPDDGGAAYARNFMDCNCLRVAPVGGAVSLIDADTPPAKRVSDRSYWRVGNEPNYDVAGTSSTFSEGYGAGSRPLFSAADVRAALEALPNGGVGNFAVSGDGDPNTPLKINFINDLGGAAHPLLAALDPAVSVSRSSAGGILPTFKVNGAPVAVGAPELRTPYWGEGTHNSNGTSRPRTPYLPTAYFPILQDEPAVQYEDAVTYLNAITGSWAFLTGSGLARNPRITNSPHTGQATWTRQALRGGGATYRVSVTWPAAAGRSSAVTYTVKNRAGETLATATVDQTAIPPDDADRGVTWKVLGMFALSGITDDLIITQSNGTNLPMVADVVRYERTSPDTSIVIGPDDVVTYSSGEGWASTALGAVAAATDAPVANLAGTPIYPPLPATRNMDVGIGIGGESYYAANRLYANLARSTPQFGGATNADGYPTKIPSSPLKQLFSFYQDSFQADGRGWPGVPPGNYVLMWDGLSDLRIEARPQNGTAITGQATGNRRYYRLDAARNCYGVSDLYWQVYGTTQNGDGSWNVDLSNIRLLPLIDGVDPDDPPKFHPANAQKIAGLQSIRVMDLTGAIAGNSVNFEDYNRPQTNISRTTPPRQYRLAVSRFEPYIGPEIWKAREGQAWRITTVNPHNLADGMYISFDATQPFGLVTYSDGSTKDVKLMYGHVIVLSETELYFAWGPGSATSATVITNPTSRLLVNIGSPAPIADAVDLANAHGVSLHFNVTAAASDDCVRRLGEYFAANLAPGLKCRVAYANEIWNYFQPNYSWCCRQGARFYGAGPDNPVPYHLHQARRCWDLMQPAFDAAGRSGDLIKVLESQHEYPGGPTSAIAQYARSIGLAFDELAVAPYYFNRPSFAVGGGSEPAFRAILDALTPDQVLDIYEVHTTYGGWGKEMKAHRVYLDQNGYRDVKIITYEGGPERMLPMLSNADQGRRSHAAHRHPRFFGLMQHTLRLHDEGGCSLFQQYLMNGGDAVFGGEIKSWSSYTGTAQAPYTPGDPAQDAIQINQPDRLDLIKSVTGGALKAYAALPTPTPTPTPPPPPTPTPVTPIPRRPYPLLPARVGPSPARIPFRPIG